MQTIPIRLLLFTKLLHSMDFCHSQFFCQRCQFLWLHVLYFASNFVNSFIFLCGNFFWFQFIFFYKLRILYWGTFCITCFQDCRLYCWADYCDQCYWFRSDNLNIVFIRSPRYVLVVLFSLLVFTHTQFNYKIHSKSKWNN